MLHLATAAPPGTSVCRARTKARVLVAALIGVLAGAAGLAHAQPSAEQLSAERSLSRAADALERALARHGAVLDAEHRQLAPPTALTDLFPARGFAPPPSWVGASIAPLDADRTRVCLSAQVQRPEQWAALVRFARARGYARASSACVEHGSWAPAPALTELPLVVSALRDFDRRAVPVPTRVDPGLSLPGVTPRNALPALTLGAQPLLLVVANPAVPWSGTCATIGQAPAYLLPALQDACAGVPTAQWPATAAQASLQLQTPQPEAGPGLLVNSPPACTSIPAQGSCEYAVEQAGAAPAPRFAALRLQWQQVPVAQAGGVTASSAAVGVQRAVVGILLEAR
jgi:hypothetical protein